MQNHVGILQNEYHRMMQKADELERENSLLRASAGVADGLNFTSRIMKSVSELYNNKKYRSGVALMLSLDNSSSNNSLVYFTRCRW